MHEHKKRRLVRVTTLELVIKRPVGVVAAIMSFPAAITMRKLGTALPQAAPWLLITFKPERLGTASSGQRRHAPSTIQVLFGGVEESGIEGEGERA